MTVRRITASALTLALFGGCFGNAQETGAGPQTASGALTAPSAVSTTAVEPRLTQVDDNPTCQQLGLGRHEFKVDSGPFSGVWRVDDHFSVTLASADGIQLSFSSPGISLDAVIVKGGSGALVYEYPEEAAAGEALHSPVNPVTGQPYAISHVSLCYDYELRATLTARSSFRRTFAWSVAKSGDLASLTLAPNERAAVGYQVTAASTGWTDGDFTVEGEVQVVNPAPFAATMTSLELGAEGAPLALDCDRALTAVLAAGEAVSCGYRSAMPDAAARALRLVVTAEGIVGGSSAEVTTDPALAGITTVDACARVLDSLEGDFGVVCAAEGRRTFGYSRVFGPFAATECGSRTIPNIATIAGVESGTIQQAAWSVAVEVTCPPQEPPSSQGCTSTPGYWKTHSSLGPAPYDSTWRAIGETSPFFQSRMTWLEALGTPPKGEAYYTLARAYAAATLNGLRGADTSVVKEELASAGSLLDIYDGDPKRPSSVRGKTRESFTALAEKIDAFNNGVIGPGHCGP